MVFTVFILFLLVTRIGELLLSRRNEKWLLQQGAIEYGRKHYPLIIAIHSAYFVSLLAEYFLRPAHAFSMLFLLIYFFLLGLKIWVVFSLGKFWTTKIYRIPEIPLVKKGPYRYFAHPNYFIVVVEIAIIPLVFHLYFTAILFSLLNVFVLSIRIREEDRVL